MYDAIIMGSSPAGELGGCDRSSFCQAQHFHDEYARECDFIFAPVNFRRIGFVILLFAGNMRTCDQTMDRRQRRQLSPANPKLDS
jgi:hypothetical protein